jgi:hypothetical protein
MKSTGPAEFAARGLATLSPFDFVEAAYALQGSIIIPKRQPNLSRQLLEFRGALQMF